MASESKGKSAQPGTQQGGPQAPAAPAQCAVKTCKKKDERFGFCSEHYEHFKFGLVKKDGVAVLDYDKKLEHFMAWKSRQGGRKAA